MENTGEADYFSQRRGSVSRYDDPPPEDAARQAAASSSSSTETTATTNNTAITGTSTSASTLDAAAGQPRSADTTMMVASQPPMADFDSSFLAIAAAARAQAEASASTNSAYSSGDVHPPPVPYSGASAPFPLRSRHQRTAMLHAPSEDPKAARNDIEAADEADAEELSKTRCYWAVLSTAPASSPMSSPDSSPTFLYLDPVFAKHMGAQAEAMLGTSFFDYIHPEEKARAEVDMRNIIDSRTLFGSVSRCRYSRVPRIRRMLGAKEPPTPKEVKALQGQQADFIPIDIVVNWIGADLALCFFHAIIDKSPQDNDEERKTEWSNWCGMPQGSFTAKDSQDLWSNVRSVRKLEPSVTGPAYVFQILSADALPDVLFSWPPPRLYPQGARERQDGHDAQVSYADGSYFPDDFAKLAQGVDSLKRELSDANTSCTRRYRAKHTLTTDAMLRGVESVLIPYGSIVLACFGTSYAQLVGGLDSMGAVAPRQPQAAPLQNASQGRPLDASSQAAFSAYPRKKSKTSFSPDAATRAGAASSDDGSGTSVATLAAVAAAAAAQTKRCESCGTSNSPEWRKGPDGSKSMCNACGLRYSRSIARARKREERARIAAEVAANGGVIPPHLRKQPGQQQKQKQQKQPRQKEKHKHLVEADEKEAAIDSAPHESRQHGNEDFLSSTAGASFDPNASQGPGGPLDMARAAAQVAAAAAGLQ